MRASRSLSLLVLMACVEEPQPSSGSFSALTYNVHGLPPEITGDDTSARMVEIAPLLNGFAIVGLQEDFDDQNHELLENASDHQTAARFDEALEGRAYGSGLAFFADYAEQQRVHEHFTACHGTLDNASDCLASKGFQRLRLELGGEASLDVYNTHLEAGGSDEDNSARQAQVEQVLLAIDTWSQGRALLFLGDYNLHDDEEPDATLLARLLDEAQLQDACEYVDCEEPGHIDRLLFRSGDSLTLSAQAWANEPAFVDSQGAPLSDHDAISAQFAWEIR